MSAPSGCAAATSECALALELLERSKQAIKSATADLEEAKEISEKAGLSIETSILAPTLPGIAASSGPAGVTGAAAPAYPPILSTTGGYSNVDHFVQSSGDSRADRLAEFKRAYRRRARAETPEQRGEDRWDLPRITGGRRRRIHRDIDQPSAPPEPPTSGYILYIAHMTQKVRHDRPNEHHNQPAVVKEISKIWSYSMSDSDREYYNRFAREAQNEYKQQYREFRATGGYRKSRTFMKLENGKGPWVRIRPEDRNALEREVAGYDTVIFPLRPVTAPKPAWEIHREAVAKRQLEKRQKEEKKLLNDAQ
mmetsp:Transcript_45892/g.85322  ORF Transcript_45892/g.85322 Transcript_45892/m.85322 type:complete len:309 (-) Transcript_45892:185-1111(-)